MDVHDFLAPAASLNLAGVLFGLLVVVNAYEEDVASIFRYLGWIFLTLDLRYGGVNCVVEFELYDKCWLGDVAARNLHKVGKALVSGMFTMDDVPIPCSDIGYGEHAGERVLIIVKENAGALIESNIDCLRHRLLVACNGDLKKVLRVFYGFCQ